MPIAPISVQTTVPNTARQTRVVQDRSGLTQNVTGQTVPAQKNSGKKILGATVLLIGGALLGYGHKDYISKGIEKAKTAITNFCSTGTPATLLEKGKDLVAKAKNAIFAK